MVGSNCPIIFLNSQSIIAYTPPRRCILFAQGLELRSVGMCFNFVATKNCLYGFSIA